MSAPTMDDRILQVQNSMYQYSRAIYRSIKDLVDQSPETILGNLAKQNFFPLEVPQCNALLTKYRSCSVNSKPTDAEVSE